MAYGSVNVPGATGREVKEAQNAAAAAQSTANAASQSAAGAVTTANSAMSKANEAELTAAAAARTANTARSTADSAASTAATAASNASTALSAAQAAATAAANAQSAADNAQAAADAAADAVAEMNKTVYGLPSQRGTLVYDGTARTPSWNGYDADKLDLTITAQTDAGDYTAVFTPKTGYQWWDETTAGKTVSWSITPETLAIPAQSGTLTYDGTARTPSWDANYDSTKMTLAVTAQTDAGDYTAVFTPVSANYRWPDGTNTAKTAPWTIAKAAGSLSLSPAALSITGATGDTRTIAVTRSGDGAITAVSSNTAAATCTVSGNTVTVASVASGSATITVRVGEGANHLAPADAACAVTVEVSAVYGAAWDGTSTAAWSRTDDAAGFTDPAPYVSGASSYGSPFDNISPWKDMVRVTDSEAGEMVKIPKFYYKLTQSGAGLKIQISAGAQPGFSVCPACMDRGDGSGERDYVLVGRYHCGTSNYKSATGVKPKVSITRSTARTAIHNLGAKVWQMDWATRFTIWLLYLVEFADWNSQAKIGYGCGNNSAVQNMGASDSMPYHTGTMQTSRTAYGVGVQYRYIEGLWDNCLDWVDGCYNNSGGLNIIKNPSSFSDSANGVLMGKPSGGYPSAFAVTSNGGFPAFYPTAASGSDSTYSCDYWAFNASYPCVCAGGSYYWYQESGLFYFYYGGTSYSHGGVGSRSMKLP